MRTLRMAAAVLLVMGFVAGCKMGGDSKETAMVCPTCNTEACACAHCAGDENAECTCLAKE